MKQILLCILMTALPLDAATVAHYKFDAPLVDGPIYELTDSSGNGHHGRVVGQELFEVTADVPPYPGVTGAALDLRGRLDYGVIPHHADFAPSGDWTIEFFIKPDLFHQEHGGETNLFGPFRQYLNTNLSYTILAKHNTNQPTLFNSAWAFHYQPDQGRVIFAISFGADRGEVMAVGRDLRDGKWHHIAIVFAASEEYEIRLFVDGFQHQSHNIGNVPFSWGEGPIYVGAWARQDSGYWVNDRNFDGLLDEIRFSNAALDTESFVVNFGPLWYPAIPLEAHASHEIQFQSEAGKIYRIEQINPATGVFIPIGYAHGEGGPKSFFHRRDFFAPPAYQVVLDSTTGAQPLPFTLHDAIEIRFPTAENQLYQITKCESISCQEPETDFVLGDGAKMSYFQRALPNSARFYRVERY